MVLLRYKRLKASLFQRPEKQVSKSIGNNQLLLGPSQQNSDIKPHVVSLYVYVYIHDIHTYTCIHICNNNNNNKEAISLRVRGLEGGRGQESDVIYFS